MLQLVNSSLSFFLFNLFELLLQIILRSRSRVCYQEVCLRYWLQLGLIVGQNTLLKHFQCDVSNIFHEVVRHVCEHSCFRRSNLR
jgi:hypothetical protein